VHEYALVLLVLWGYGTKVADMVESGVVAITSDEALEVMALCKGRGFEGLKVRVCVTVPCCSWAGLWLVGASLPLPARQTPTIRCCSFLF
jgi:hypothetical protein